MIHPSQINGALICFSTRRGKNLPIISYDIPRQICYWTKCYFPACYVSISPIKSYPDFKKHYFFHKERVFAVQFIFTHIELSSIVSQK